MVPPGRVALDAVMVGIGAAGRGSDAAYALEMHPGIEGLPRDGSIVCFLLMRRPDGGPTGYPMTGLLRDGRLTMTTYRASAKARYLLADDRVCCVVPDAGWTGGLALYGRARPADADEFSVDGADGGPMEVPGAVRETVRERLASGKRMVFAIEVERVEAIGAEAIG